MKTMTEITIKFCEVCGIEVPQDFQNLLCLSCYDKQVKEQEGRLAQEAEERSRMGKDALEAQKEPEKPILDAMGGSNSEAEAIHGIRQAGYVERPEYDKAQWQSNFMQFDKTGVFLWWVTKSMYEFIRTYSLNKVTQHPQYPKFIWKPKIVDVGCGVGVGSNIMSNEADFVWGIDKDKKTLSFAKQCFTRVKNGIYYSSQVSFDEIDIMKDTREFLKFDLVVAIEIIEHIADYKGFLKAITSKFTKKDKTGNPRVPDPTEFFISTPNRNNKDIQKDTPKTKFHVREWTCGEFKEVLDEFFENIEMMDWRGNKVELDTIETPVMAKCSIPKI